MLAATQHCLTVVLDTRVPLEAMILNRLQRLPQRRRKDWLRNLLVTGFSAECQAIKLQTLPIHPLGTVDDCRRSKYWPMKVPSSTKHPPPTVASPGSSDRDAVKEPGLCDGIHRTKPFAHLKSVLGP